MKVFDKLGAKDEAEAIVIVDAFNAFASNLKEVTGKTEPSEMIGVVSAWKNLAESAKARADEESAFKAESLKSLEADGLVFSAEKLNACKSIVDFVGEVDRIRNDNREASELIGGLVASGRVRPEARGAFDDLFKNQGLSAVKAAASVIPAEPQVTTDPAPKTQAHSGLTEREMQLAETIKDAAQKQRFIDSRLARKENK